jgi:hypothetical protein
MKREGRTLPRTSHGVSTGPGWYTMVYAHLKWQLHNSIQRENHDKPQTRT